MADDAVGRLREHVVEVVTLGLTGLWLFGLFIGASWWLPVLLVSYIAVIPIIALLFGDDDDRAEWWDESTAEESARADSTTDSAPESSHTSRHSRHSTARHSEPHTHTHTTTTASGDTASDDSASDALETLRQRYAAGKLTDAQFEAKLERLLETETIEAADRWQREPSRDRNRVNEERQRRVDSDDGDRGSEWERERERT
ncbi:DUF2078 family protein [Natrialba magadii ATCC 43099]|uniref:DUF2078 family protein n=1 Tax=Natrialba magadii (strain ATCC 43099 / DSM 3394 / CCM 3739 / CIP 104546 / IAM 13178 / JCM 8861 / NBRC 102185 / NCIMB 2190 / MS3) TaxID=547559 RepID=D3T0A1_NATMM|nr:SHOCT domain-containing protein [Natrialba magadii]ADD04459.1 DUF2078 family protein [Natrialba magadii ATCC 43099]ELY25854.1 hypothetical protein C500_16889 [Natrialba magadii ATCC 43099]